MCAIDQSVIWHKILGDWFFAQKAIGDEIAKVIEENLILVASI